MTTRAMFSTALGRVSAIVGVALLSASSATCGLTSPSGREFVIQVDSIVAGMTIDPAGLVPVRFFGTVGGTSCQWLERVEKSASGDSLRLRFVGKSKGGNCLAMPTPLRHEELLASLPARRVTVVVEQRNGPPLARTVALPLP